MKHKILPGIHLHANRPVLHAADPGPWGKPKGSGSGGGGGWNSGGGSGRNTPPGDFDDMLRDLRQSFDRFFGGGSNRGLIIGFGILFLLWLASGFYQVQPGQQGVVQRFGRFDRLTGPGLRYHAPTPFEAVQIVSRDLIQITRIGSQDTTRRDGTETENLMLTGDENILNLGFSVQWKVRDPEAYVFNLPDPDETVRAVSESAMRDIIGQSRISDVLTTGKSKVQDDTRKLIQDTLDHYQAGIEITEVNLMNTSLPQPVVPGALDVQAARADQDRARNEAQAYENDILPRANGAAQRLLQDAEAYKQEVVIRAQGDAARFLSVDGQYRQAEGVTRQRLYLETMEAILPGMTKIILDTKSGALPYLPLPALAPHTGDKETR